MSFSFKTKLRRQDFKRTLDKKEARGKREQFALTLRNNKKEENLKKRRNIDTSGRDGGLPHNAGAGYDMNIQLRMAELRQLVDLIKSNDANVQLDATTRFRKHLSIETNPPIQEVIEAGVVPRLVEFLNYHARPELQFEAAWALTNIASGSSEQTRIVIESGAVPIFKDLLNSKNNDVKEQAVWALGNIAGDSPQCRDFVLSYNIMDTLLSNLDNTAQLSMLRNATWTLSNLCRGKPQPPWETVSRALPTLARLIYSTDDEVLTDACWAISYLSDGPNERIHAVIETGISRRLVELLMHNSYAVQTPALRSVGNIVTGDDIQTQIIINVSVLPCLLSMLSSPKKGIKKEACWTISNITAGNKAQIQAVIDAGIIGPLIKILTNSPFDIKKEAAWALSNATSGGSPEQKKHLVERGILEPLCDLLECKDARIIQVALEGIENILKVGEKEAAFSGTENPYSVRVEECGGVDFLEKLQTHPNHEIYRKVVSILEEFFHAEEDYQGEVHEINPNAQSFQFGTTEAGSSFKF